MSHGENVYVYVMAAERPGKPSAARLSRRTSGLQEHSCLQLFGADLWLGEAGPEEAYIIFKVGYRTHKTSVARRDLSGTYCWTSSPDTENVPCLCEWLLDGGEASRCELVRARVFEVCECGEEGKVPASEVPDIPNSGMSVEDLQAAISGSQANATGESAGSSRHGQLDDSGQDAVSESKDKCLGSFEVNLLAMKAQADVQTISSGSMLPSSSGGPRIVGSLTLHMVWEPRGAYLFESNDRARDTDACLQLLDSLANEALAADAVAAWPQAQGAARHLQGELVAQQHYGDSQLLEEQNMSLRQIVAQQQERIGHLKDIVLGPKQRHRSSSSATAEKKPALQPRLRVTQISSPEPKALCARASSAPSSPTSQPKRDMLADAPLGSEMQRFLREHKSKELQPCVQKLLFDLHAPPHQAATCQSTQNGANMGSGRRQHQYSSPKPVRSSASRAAAESELKRALLRHFHTPRAAFKALDLAGSGQLFFAEFRRGFELAQLNWASEDALQRLWRRAGGDETGFLTLHAFEELLRPKPR